jgi:uncharacterized protein YlbG (UPF0298 family)
MLSFKDCPYTNKQNKLMICYVTVQQVITYLLNRVTHKKWIKTPT